MVLVRKIVGPKPQKEGKAKSKPIRILDKLRYLVASDEGRQKLEHAKEYLRNALYGKNEN